jgi:hypothetical protein
MQGNYYIIAAAEAKKKRRTCFSCNFKALLVYLLYFLHFTQYYSTK